MCRLRNDVDDVLRDVLNGKPQHQLPWRLMLAATLIMLPRYQQAVRSAEPLTDRCHDAQPGADRCVLLVDGRACAGGGSCSEPFVGATIFTSGRTPLAC